MEPITREMWAKILLHELKVDAVDHAVNMLIGWQTAEDGGGPHSEWNPLNTTYRCHGSTSYNQVGVQNYTSLSQGIYATLQTLHTEHAEQYGYKKILDYLHGNNYNEFGGAVMASSWGTQVFPSIIQAVHFKDVLVSPSTVPNVPLHDQK